MAIAATQIRRGMVIVFEGQPCKVVEFRHHTPGNLRAMIQTKLRNIRTGSSFEHRFRSADTVERAAMEQHEMEYLYSDGSHHHFMNTETFDQVALSGDELGEAAQWLAIAIADLALRPDHQLPAVLGVDPDQLARRRAGLELAVVAAAADAGADVERSLEGEHRHHRLVELAAPGALVGHE